MTSLQKLTIREICALTYSLTPQLLQHPEGWNGLDTENLRAKNKELSDQWNRDKDAIRKIIELCTALKEESP